MKKAAVILRREFLPKYDAFFVGNIHDEFQLDCHPDCADEVGQAIVDSIRLAGEALNFRCPLTGAFKVGANWAECH